MTLTESILATLSYHDIFDYPLTLEEIHKYLIGKKVSLKSLSVIYKRSDRISTNGRFYSLVGRQKLFGFRKLRAKYSQPKLKRAQLYSKLLRLIPTVKLVAISGALAMENSHKNDDIDLAIITANGTLWTTRFLANLLLFPFKRKPTKIRGASPGSTRGRSSNLSKTNNKACLNLFLDEQDLKIRDQNLYTAHEICQMEPIFDRNQTYSKLISSNNWVKKFLPNWQPDSLHRHSRACPDKGGESGNLAPKKALVVSRLALVVETFLKNSQLWYMRKKISTEKIGKSQLFFHPANTQKLVLEEYQRKMKFILRNRSF